ncbi:MAG: ribose 5-phosphate isomerase B [Clostridia bacterium]|nr:ribose 5-phosphate isomerase B [Clostridia bacterium]
MIALGCDHAGYPLKEALKTYLDSVGKTYKDFGTFSEESVDYPIYAAKAAHAVADGECECGILCCGTGIGISIAANKVKGIRAAVCGDAYSTEMTRLHNDANILCMGARVISEEKAIELTEIFLKTPALNEERHQRRVAMLRDIENGKL